MVREKKGSELDSNNRDPDRDSSDESDIDESKGGRHHQKYKIIKIFSLEADTLKSYNSKGICSIALKFGQWLV